MRPTLKSDITVNGSDTSKSRVFVYHIDHADQITDVDNEWLDFAARNGAPELTRDHVLNKELWQFVSDPDTQLIYRMLFDAVRTKLRPISVTYRCDSPMLRRYMELTCLPRPKLGIELRSCIIREEPRPRAPILDREQPRSDEVATLCAWCKRYKVSEFDWREIDDAVTQLEFFSSPKLPQLSHGMCPTCHVAKLKEIRNGVKNLE